MRRRRPFVAPSRQADFDGGPLPHAPAACARRVTYHVRAGGAAAGLAAWRRSFGLLRHFEHSFCSYLHLEHWSARRSGHKWKVSVVGGKVRQEFSSSRISGPQDWPGDANACAFGCFLCSSMISAADLYQFLDDEGEVDMMLGENGAMGDLLPENPFPQLN